MTENEYCDLIRRKWQSISTNEASKELLDLTSEAIKAHPRSPQLHVLRGDLIQLASDDAGIEFDKALECYRKAVELDPQHEDAWTAIGCFLDTAANDFHGAEKAFRKAIELGGSVEAYAGLARVLAEQEREDEAISVLTPSKCPCAEETRIQETREEIERGEWKPFS